MDTDDADLLLQADLYSSAMSFDEFHYCVNAVFWKGLMQVHDAMQVLWVCSAPSRVRSGTGAINLTFHCEINTLCQPLSVSLLLYLRNNTQLIVQTPLMEKKGEWRCRPYGLGAEGGGGGWRGVPEERQNTGPETQLVIW